MFIDKTFSGVYHLKAFCYFFPIQSGAERLLDSEVWEFERGWEVSCEVDTGCALVSVGDTRQCH